MKKLLVVLAMLLLALAVTSNVLADQYGCTGQYGQYGNCPTSTTILIDKKVGKPVGQTKGGNISIQYVDNLSPNDYKFKAGNVVYFQILVKNNSSVVLTNVVVKDTLPAYLTAEKGPDDYNKVTNIITINVGTLQPDEEKVYTIKTVVKAQTELPADKSLICMVNKVDAYTSNVSDSDTSQLCVEKAVMGAKKVPAAGPEMGLVLLSGQLGLLATGFALKRKFQ